MAANSTDSGLVTEVSAQDPGRSLRAAESPEGGVVGLNRGIVLDPVWTSGPSRPRA